MKPVRKPWRHIRREMKSQQFKLWHRATPAARGRERMRIKKLEILIYRTHGYMI